MVFISLFFLLFAIVNFVIRTFRTTPLRAVDFRVAKSVMTIVNMYMKPWQIILSIIAIIAVVLFLVVLWIKTKKIRPKYIRSILAILLVAALAYGSMTGARSIGAVATHFDNVTNAYTKYGLVYCFGLSLSTTAFPNPMCTMKKTSTGSCRRTSLPAKSPPSGPTSFTCSWNPSSM